MLQFLVFVIIKGGKYGAGILWAEKNLYVQLLVAQSPIETFGQAIPIFRDITENHMSVYVFPTKTK